MNKRVNPDKIIKDCTYVIERLIHHPDIDKVRALLPERNKAHFYRGRAKYNKGVVLPDQGCFSNAEHDFAQVARNSNADPNIRVMALYYCGVCWGKLHNDDLSKDYFEKALNKFDEIADNPNTDYEARVKALYYCSCCCTDLWEIEHVKSYLEKAEVYIRKAEESGFVDEPQLHYLGAIVQKSEDLKKRVMGKLGITEDSE